ncbi:MAG: hypothetical protein Q8880_12575 [Bacteroidota bacterium]|nr:hypothetical protein [Bacteroidota bacterium]
MSEKLNNNLKIINTAIFAGILMALIFIYLQISNSNNTNKINTTYSIYKDIVEWENTHKEAISWVNNPDTVKLKYKYRDWEFDDYLGYYEMIYSLKKKNMIDMDLVYELTSSGLEGAYEANNFELRNLIQQFRKEDNDPEIYIGVEKLYNEFKGKRKYMKKL